MDNKCVEKLLETVAFSNGCICSVELIRWEHTHFHPSGDCTPSKPDMMVAERIKQLSDLMGVYFLENLIIGADKSCFSFFINVWDKENNNDKNKDHVEA